MATPVIKAASIIMTVEMYTPVAAPVDPGVASGLELATGVAEVEVAPPVSKCIEL